MARRLKNGLNPKLNLKRVLVPVLGAIFTRGKSQGFILVEFDAFEISKAQWRFSSNKYSTKSADAFWIARKQRQP